MFPKVSGPWPAEVGRGEQRWVLQGEDEQPALGSAPVQPQLEIDEECLLAQADGSPSYTLPSPPCH